MSQFFRVWPGWLMAGLTFMAGPGRAQVDSPSQTAAAVAPRSALRFELDVQAPAELREFLLRHLDLQRFRELPDLDDAELSRLIAQVPGNAAGLLATQGYAAPQVWVQRRDDPASPFSAVQRITVHVTPGPPVRVAQVRLTLQGDIERNAAAAAQREALHSGWMLGPGQVFTQGAWDQAKAQALRGLSVQRYPGARILASRAEIDAQTHSAALSLTLDSGPPLRLGDVAVSGTARYEAGWARSLARQAGLTPGSDYDQTRVLEAQRRIAASGYFDSVFVFVDPGDDPGHASVRVKVHEAPLQKLVLGAGGSTDNGPRLSLEHTHHRVPGLGWRAVSTLNLERDNRALGSTLSAPVDDRGWGWMAAAQIERQGGADVVTDSRRLRAGQTQDGVDITRSLFVQHDRTRSAGPLQPAAVQSALSAHYSWSRRQLDGVPFPEAGHGLSVELGAGVTLQRSRQPFLRGRVRVLAYEPLARSVSGRLALRAEAGAVLARPGAEVPSSELFLTGGDNTVRGWGPRTIGAAQAGGGVAAGRYLAVGSVEWQRPLQAGSERGAWESTLFVDAGAVSNALRGLRPQVGVGVGARYRSPVGPLQLDLAYGVQVRRWRLHLALGFRF